MTPERQHTNEATTEILFPTGHDFHDFRAEVRDRYHPTMVDVERAAVYKDGRTRAYVHHARGLGAELKGLAYGHHNGNSVRTIFHTQGD